MVHTIMKEWLGASAAPEGASEPQTHPRREKSLGILALCLPR